MTWFVHQLGGSVECRHGARHEMLEAGESAVIAFDAGESGQCVLAGGGEVVLVKLEKTAAQM